MPQSPAFRPCRPRSRGHLVARLGSALAATALAGGSVLVMASPGTAATTRLVAVHPNAITWGKVTTIGAHTPSGLTSLTTNSGMVVAAWTSRNFDALFVATRTSGDPWSAPVEIAGSAAAVDLAKNGKGAWLAWQGFDHVNAVQVNPDGSIGSPDVVGDSSDPFVDELHIVAGANGSVAATWRTQAALPSELAYRPAGGDWQPVEQLPTASSVEGLVLTGSGAVQFVLADGPDKHQELNYLRRTAGGIWRDQVIISSNAYLPTVAGNTDGDLVVGWEVVNDDFSVTLVARYKAAGDADFGEAHHLDESVPNNSYVALAMASDGSLAAAYRIDTEGTQEIQMTPADSTGLWLDPQNLSLTGTAYDVAMSAKGNFVVTSQSVKAGVQVVRCDAADVCEDAETNPATGHTLPTASISRGGAINLVWGQGCKGEECRPTEVVAQRGH